MKIHLDQTIAAFSSKAFPRPVEAKLRRYQESTESDPSYHIIAGQDDTCQAQISFTKTPRVPENKLHYPAPDSLGRFPLYDVNSFGEYLPTSMVAQGGVFLPINGMQLLRQNTKPRNTPIRRKITSWIGLAN
jgi:hypothetical protein